MRLATTDHAIRSSGLRAAFARGERPAVGFTFPDDVVKDPYLSFAEKREILIAWASDASAVQDHPTLRWLLGTPEPVPFADVRDALLRLERRGDEGAGVETVEFRVAPVAGGWMIEGPPSLQPLVVRSGGRAEAKAEALARAVTATGAHTSVVVLDRRGAPIGVKRFRPAACLPQTTRARR